MTVSRQHQDWINHGRPDSGLARPLMQLRDVLRAVGYVVYDQPDDSHLNAVPPEDHTYYSETGFPEPSPKWWRHAIDIMPGGKGLPTLQELGQRIFVARQAGQITWLKYMNWPSTGNLDHAVQDRWEPDHQRSTSSDVGHIHISSITGVETLDAPYNPFDAMLSGDDDMYTDDDRKRALDIYNWARGAVTGRRSDGSIFEDPYDGAPAVGIRALGPLQEQVDKLTSALAAVQSQASSNGSGLTSVLTALSALSSKLDGIGAKVAELQASADVPITITGTGTAHIGGASS